MCKTKAPVTNLLFLVLLYNFPVLKVSGARQRYVTCGSVIKLLNTDHHIRLHSHDVKYGTGSGQQSVTGLDIQEDVNSHWVVKAANTKECSRGEPIKCGSTIRLEHLATKKNLHSHYFSSPLSGFQEISCYGDDEGEGDSGDNWVVVCSGDYWSRDDNVMLKHKDTDQYLAASGRTFGRPINGQMEIVGLGSSGSVHWQAAEGVYLHAPDFAAKHIHTEL